MSTVTQLTLTMTYILFGFEMLAAWVLIVSRHAIPRSPVGFHVAITIPMWISVAFCFLIAIISRADPNSLFGITLPYYRLVLAWSIMVWLGILIYYSYWWHMHGRNEDDEG